MSRPSSKLGHVGSKTRSLGQILEKPCVHSRGHRFDSKFMKLYENANDHNIKVTFETGSCGSKTRSLGQILEKPCVHSRGHSFDSKVMKLYWFWRRRFFLMFLPYMGMAAMLVT